MPSTLSKEQKKKNNEEVDINYFQKKRLEASLLIIGAAHFSFFFDWSSGLDSFQHILTTLSNNNSAVQTSYVSNIDSMSAIASVFVTPYWGDLCDRYGRKPLLLASPLIACVCNILFAYSPSWTTVFLKKFKMEYFNNNGSRNTFKKVDIPTRFRCIFFLSLSASLSLLLFAFLAIVSLYKSDGRQYPPKKIIPVPTYNVPFAPK